MSISLTPSALPNQLEPPSYSLTRHYLHPKKCHAFASTTTKHHQSYTKTSQKSTGIGYLSQGSLLAKNVAGLLHSMDFTNPGESTRIYALILQNCKKVNNLELGLQVHGHLIVNGVELCAFLGSQLVEWYAKLELVDDSRKVFEKLGERNVFSWTSMMEMYNGLGCYEETINLFYLMMEERVRPDHMVFPKVFKACSKLQDFGVGKNVYDYMLSIGFEGNAFVKSSYLDMFIKCGRVDFATGLLEEMEEGKGVVIWNVMISGYASRGYFKEALNCVKDMKTEGITPDQVTWNSIIAGFAQHGRFEEASKYFLEVRNLNGFKPNVVSWSALIAGNEQNGRFFEALNLFRQMMIDGVKPNSVTFASVISACANLSLVRHGKEVHGYCVKTDQLDLDMLVENSLVGFYAKCLSSHIAYRKFSRMKQKDLISWNAILAGYALRGGSEEAMKLLDEMELQGLETDVVTWNGLITGCTQNRDGKTALQFFSRMQEAGVRPNSTTISGALAACSQLEDLKIGKEIHGYALRNQIELSTGVGSALLSMYSACDSLETGYLMFKELSEKDAVTWNSIIAACAQRGNVVTALNLLRNMVLSKVEPDTVTMVSALPACSRIAALTQGKEIHQFIIKHGLDSSNFVQNAVIDMYARCGPISKSRKIFDLMPNRDTISWNVMISGYGMHGLGIEAVRLFEKMRISGVKPNHVTFTNLLTSCSHTGLVLEGWKYFEVMRKEYEMEPELDQYCCMVDLMARAGKFDETLEFIKNMPCQPNAAVWGALLGACRIHGNAELAEYAAKHVFELEPENSGNYILLSNIYSAAGRWEDVSRIRCLMKNREVIKSPACSWIEVKRKVYSFIIGDNINTHPLMDKVYVKLKNLLLEIKKVGYVPDTKYVLQNVEDHEKELSLCGHSEKLALAFGLISTSAGTPLRIIKNLRVCGDCHSAIKYISKVEKREITMRDGYRFHRFIDGVCSCGDYW
ncbi:hypothetical protein ACFE04_028438 [Oxalis oulophora]